jgi:hypothetical protein
LIMTFLAGGDAGVGDRRRNATDFAGGPAPPFLRAFMEATAAASVPKAVAHARTAPPRKTNAGRGDRECLGPWHRAGSAGVEANSTYPTATRRGLAVACDPPATSPERGAAPSPADRSRCESAQRIDATARSTRASPAAAAAHPRADRAKRTLLAALSASALRLPTRGKTRARGEANYDNCGRGKAASRSPAASWQASIIGTKLSAPGSAGRAESRRSSTSLRAA